MAKKENIDPVEENHGAGSHGDYAGSGARRAGGLPLGMLLGGASSGGSAGTGGYSPYAPSGRATPAGGGPPPRMPSLTGRPSSTAIAPTFHVRGNQYNPNTFYQGQQQNVTGNTFEGSTLQSRLPMAFYGNAAGEMGTAQLASLMRDPYATPDSLRRETLEGSEQAYQVAAQRMRGDTLSSGAGRGGVAQGMRGQVEQARGADMARGLREFEQFVTNLGDTRLRSMLIPYLNTYNQAVAIAKGNQPVQQGSNDFANFATLADLGIKLADLWV